MARSRSWLVIAAACLVASSGCGDGDTYAAVEMPAPAAAWPSPSHRDAINPRLLRRFRPIAVPAASRHEPSPEKVALGRMLWFEPRLSRDDHVTCNTCHSLAAYGVDGKKTSVGVDGQVGRRNAPTVYNAAEHFVQFWDGRVPDVEEQAKGPLLSPKEMGSTRELVESRLRAIPAYRAAFKSAFPAEAEPVTFDNVAVSIAAFERRLKTRSRWDDYLAGKKDALTPKELHGLRVFIDVGCMSCHTGPQMGASMFQVAGVMQAWPEMSDLGRFEVTHVPSDRMVFKVPTLKNVARTAPYFHDGSCATLPEAVRIMGERQLGVELSEGEVGAIVTFLDSLTGELPAELMAPPPPEVASP